MHPEMEKLEEISRHVTDLRLAMASLTAEVKASNVARDSAADGLKNTASDHETRLRRLERVIWTASGMTALVGTVIGVTLPKIFGF